MPRPEIDLLAFKHCNNEVTAFEVKSFLDTAGVVWDELNIERAPLPTVDINSSPVQSTGMLSLKDLSVNSSKEEWRTSGSPSN